MQNDYDLGDKSDIIIKRIGKINILFFGNS